MKRLFALTACSLALLLGTAPLLAACGDVQTDEPALELPADDLPVLPDLGDPDEPELDAPAEETEPDEPTDEPEAEPDVPVTEPEPEPEPDIPVVSTRAEYIYVRTNSLNVRTGAGTSYASLGAVNSGDMLHFVRKVGSWYETRYRSKTAYVSASDAYTTIAYLDKGSEQVERVIAEGLELLGVPYVYGATRLHDGKGNMLKGFTVTKFDCSSLMQYIFYQGAGILLDVTTRTQVKQGVAVSWNNIKRGDLLFYTNAQRYNKTGVERIGHVALYLGNNYILHTASDYAVIEQMSATRKEYFVTARRFF